MMAIIVPSTGSLPEPDVTSAEAVWQGAVAVGVSMRSGSLAAPR
ncbi:hypothetical protein HMPREF9621_01655 [Cutibacterium modestum HL037PA2]|uniref:Uncharacterized protein n=1 Tax=Cutibacterium modestum HL044PA1 TaxID=765109 RepID=A0ABP2K9F1_9ACTN|nr:hypothetical protein HMPREF9621_01655 [Cutibacterium modestum HL037PA2]EFS92697.1 hypothetical protein HMPREF9607_01228 [Cutibacterium modestum HL044PA1]